MTDASNSTESPRAKRLKVITILGTRPEIIRLSRVMSLLDETLDHVIVNTEQNYDYHLNELFFKELNLRKPDYSLGIDCSSLGKIYGNILIAIEKVLIKEKPDAVLILGDTNSSLAGIMAKRMKIPIYHMEAGNRCFDSNVPEEINRRIIDHISDFNLVYTEHARRNLLMEGIHPRSIFLTGSPMKEVLSYFMDRIQSSKILEELNLGRESYVLVSLHREENVDNKLDLSRLLDALERVCEEFNRKVIVSTHPRTRGRLESLSRTGLDERIHFLNPFGFLDYVHLELNAFCVISDSGSISEEASILSFPAITTRNASERPEAMDSGNIILTGLDPDIVIQSIKIITKERKPVPTPAEYAVTNTAQRVVRLIMGTAKLSHLWSGIRLAEDHIPVNDHVRRRI